MGTGNTVPHHTVQHIVPHTVPHRITPYYTAIPLRGPELGIILHFDQLRVSIHGAYVRAPRDPVAANGVADGCGELLR